MKWLLIAIIVFAQQPAKIPQHKKATEANRTENTRNSKAAKNDHAQPAQPTPAASQTPVGPEGQRNATPTNDKAPQGNKQTSEEDRSTQRKLTWFTGILATVGVLQLVVMFLTWIVYRRQAGEMRRQRHEIRHQRHVMFRQWRAMQDQGGLMERQAEILEKSVAAAEQSAISAAKSAEIAAQNIELYISKERARLRIELKPLSLMPKFETTNFYTVDFDVAVDGPTAAYVTNTACVAFAMPSQVIDEEEVGSAIMMNMPLLPQVILPNSEPTEHSALFLSDSLAIHNLLPEIQSGNFLVGIRGSVSYKDVFDRNHETAFRYAWRFDEFFADGKHGRWEKCGKPEENRET